jgi:hypothetical protein
MKTKILLFLAISLFTVFVSNAQIKPGRYLLGGSISYYNRSNPTDEASYTNVQFGKITKNNSVIGIIGSYSSNNFNYSLSAPNKTKTYNAGIFYRKYKGLGNNFYFFGELDASYSYSKNIQEFYNVNQGLKSKSSGMTFPLFPVSLMLYGKECSWNYQCLIWHILVTHGL